MIVLRKVRSGAFTRAVRSGALLVALAGVPRVALAQETPPPAGNDAPSVTAGPTPGNGAPPAPPTAPQAGPPPSQPYGTTPGQPGSPPPGQSYPPGYGPPPGYAPGYAPPGYMPPRSPPPEPMHTGTYVNLHVGGGFTSISGSDGAGNTTKLAASGPAFGVAVGGAPIPNLAVFGSLFFTGASQPKITNNGTSTSSSLDALVGGFGAGIVYYFMPVNIYLSGAVAALDFQASDANNNTVYTTNAGVGFDGIVGKEFMVSEHWGLGGALEFVAASSMKDKDHSNVKWSAAAFNVLFTASYF